MKRLKKICAAALSLCLLITAAFPVLAAEENYTYTVRFFAGRQGLFGGQDEMMEIRDLRFGDRVSFSQGAVTLNDNSKYYIRGIRESGKDNNTVSQTPSFTVTGDQDYVVAYGILGDATSYTINYETAGGRTLAPSETYYGNVGDRPVVAYKYIEGYRPQAYNLTRTLQKDPQENIFTFVYTRIQTGNTGGGSGSGGGGGDSGGGAGAGGTGGGAGAGGDANAGGDAGTAPAGVTVVPGDGAADAGAGADGGAAGADAGGVEAPDGEVPQAQTPEDIIDLDDEEVPLSGLPSILQIGNDAKLLGIPVPVVAALGLVLLGCGWYFIMAKKKKKREEGP